MRRVSGPLLGRLGNQMFIYAFAHACSLRFGIPGVVTERLNKEGYNAETRLDCFQLSNDVTIDYDCPMSFRQTIGNHVYGWIMGRFGNNHKVKSKIEKALRGILHLCGCHFSIETGIPLPKRMKECSFIGYFQSEHFFKDFEEDIREDFIFVKSKISRAILLGNEILQNRNACAVHIRRGDYVNNSVFGVCNDDYYRRAIKMMKELIPDVKFYVFSDDVADVKSILGDVLSEAIYIDPKYNDQESLYLGSQCGHFIISNSSYSWWMQYLSKNNEKIVIAPSKWHLNDTQRCEVYMNSWNLIDV